MQGFITAEEFLSIPELSINPLAKRLAFFFESINFKEFLGLLSAFSAKASRDEKLRFMFNVFDVDGGCGGRAAGSGGWVGGWMLSCSAVCMPWRGVGRHGGRVRGKE